MEIKGKRLLCVDEDELIDELAMLQEVGQCIEYVLSERVFDSGRTVSDLTVENVNMVVNGYYMACKTEMYLCNYSNKIFDELIEGKGERG